MGLIGRSPALATVWLAFAVGVGAISLELAADTQLRRFVAAGRPGAVMDHGLWGWSCHPNYVGEIGLRFFLALFGIAAALPKLVPRPPRRALR